MSSPVRHSSSSSSSSSSPPPPPPHSPPTSGSLGQDIYHPFTGEKLRGMLASAAASVLGNLLNVFGQSVLGLNPLLSTTLFLQGGASFVGYILDILFAKSSFSGRAVPYSDLATRTRWLVKSFISSPFMKYVVTVIIDTLIMVELLKTILDFLDAKEIRFKFRNEVCAAVVSVLTFILYVNAMRFNWAYVDSENVLINVLMLAWLALTMMIFCVSRNMRNSRNVLITPIITSNNNEEEEGQQGNNNDRTSKRPGVSTSSPAAAAGPNSSRSSISSSSTNTNTARSSSSTPSSEGGIEGIVLKSLEPSYTVWSREFS